MKYNYHTHTTRCHHAVGTEREYIECAIAAGIKELGFSDHVPYRFPNFASGIRMAMEEIPGYIRVLSELQKEYQEEISIHIGFEAEYFPELFEGLLDELSQYPYEYLILGQHFLAPEPEGLYAGGMVTKEADLQRYVELALEGLATGKFLYLAHPDLVNYTGADKIYRKHMERLCLGAKEKGIPLELNLLGYADRRNYPCRRFFEIAAEVGNEVILGTDAHRPDMLSAREPEKGCRKFARELHLNLIEKSLFSSDS